MKLPRIVILSTIMYAIVVAGARADSIPVYTKMQKDLKELKADFNAASGRTRLVFILSPT